MEVFGAYLGRKMMTSQLWERAIPYRRYAIYVDNQLVHSSWPKPGPHMHAGQVQVQDHVHVHVHVLDPHSDSDSGPEHVFLSEEEEEEEEENTLGVLDEDVD